jgi:hypothetical protein
MRKFCAFCATVGLLLTWSGSAESGGDDGRAIIKKAIEAAGGEAKLAKFQSAVFIEKGTYYGMGDGLPYEGVYKVKWPGQFFMDIKGVFSMGIDGDTGWVKDMGGVKAMTKEQFAVEKTNLQAGFIASLSPLKDDAFNIKVLGGAKVDGKPASAVEVSRKGYPTVRLYFSKETSLLIKSRFRTKMPEKEFKEVLRETDYSDYRAVDGAKFPHKIVLKNDGKLFVEAEVTEMKAAKFGPNVFKQPAE